ncbi:MAG: PbpA [Desulfobacterales bacterium]|nr:PbpA [Desulfobacterales bacterium]
MFKRSKLNTRIYAPRNRWRDYQVKLRKQSAKHKALQRLPRYLLVLAVLLVLTQGTFWLLGWRISQPETSANRLSNLPPRPLDQSVLCRLLAEQPLSKVTGKKFDLETVLRDYHMETSIVPSLQKAIEDNIDRKYAKYFGLVAMDPPTGKVLAMISFDRTGGNANVCTRADFPAASLFKIVTAGAAIEECGFQSGTPVAYNGKKHSLYKSQLKPIDNKYTNHITFANSFADSINPVFGKIGIHRLKKDGLEKYAESFGFNRAIAFDLPVSKSPLSIRNEPYNWAEIACGFNKKTLISPLHAAVLVAGIVNGGKLMGPTLIDIAHENNQRVYQARPLVLNRAVSPDTANVLKRLMHSTITEGTARNTFRYCRRDKVLSRLYIGGKTGSINNNPEKIKYDWFAGFAEETNGSKKLAIAVFVAHKDYIGKRAAAYAKTAFKQYFKKPSIDSSA